MDLKAKLCSELFRLADIKLAADGTSRPAIARSALNDNTFFKRLERDENFTIDTYLRVARWLSENWPETVAWPAEIERPAPADAEAAS